MSKGRHHRRRRFLQLSSFVTAAAAISLYHKLLLNPGTLKLSTDPLVAEVGYVVPVDILIDLVEILVNSLPHGFVLQYARDGGKPK